MMRCNFFRDIKKYSFKSKKSYEGIVWESVKEKYELIKNDFLEAFPSENKSGFHGKSLFAREKIAVKIWSRSPDTKGISSGLDGAVDSSDADSHNFESSTENARFHSRS